jgi:hypothetical protein
MNWGHYGRDYGSSGSWLKPLGCPGASFEFWYPTTSPPDDGNSFGLQVYSGPGSYPEMYTYQNAAYFVTTRIHNHYCSGSQSVVYTVRTDAGMGKPGTTGYDSNTGAASCTYVDAGAEQGYNCTATVPAGGDISIRTKHYVGVGSAARWTFVHRTLRPDWSGPIYQWDNWGYSQVSGA